MLKYYLKMILSNAAITLIIRVRKFLRYTIRKQILKRAIKKKYNIKLIVGAAETYQVGWFSTNEQWLDITKDTDWISLFGQNKNVTHIVAEHVFEHLTKSEASQALDSMVKHLVVGGRIRIAVPDGFNPNPDYIRHVSVNGIGDDATDHKQLLNFDTLSDMLIRSGCDIEHIEGYQSNGKLLVKKWSLSDGFIRRSRQNKTDNSWNFPDASTSLIVDGIKK